MILDIQHNKVATRVASRANERLQTQDLRKLGNIRKMSNLSADAAQCPVFLSEIKLGQQLSKNPQNQMTNFLSLVEFYQISLLCAKYFGQDCLSKQTFGRNLAQSPLNSKFWTFSVTLKHFCSHDKNIQQVSYVKVPNLMVLGQHYF